MERMQERERGGGERGGYEEKTEELPEERQKRGKQEAFLQIASKEQSRVEGDGRMHQHKPASERKVCMMGVTFNSGVAESKAKLGVRTDQSASCRNHIPSALNHKSDTVFI